MSMRIHEEQIKTAHPTESLKALRLKRQVYRFSEDGDLEKRCNKCNEYWPADTEFFYSNEGKGDGLSGYCKACYIENRYPTGRGSVGHKFGVHTNKSGERHASD